MIEIKNVGLLSSFQDKGRTGKKKHGVSSSGCLDNFSYELANLLCGNKKYEACIEILGGGFLCVFHQDSIISITGPKEIFAINNNFTYLTNSSVEIKSGDELFLSPSKNGNVFYLSIAGGFRIKKILDSSSYHQPSNITDNLRISNGDHIPINKIQSKLRKADFDFFENRIFNKDKIRIIYDEEIEKNDNFVSKFEKRTFSISDQINRQGIRLKGEKLNYFKNQNEISSAVSPGTVQLPPSGLPIILLNDSQTTGGYKKIGSIPKFQLSKISQIPLLSKIQFRGISRKAAVEEYKLMTKEFINVNFNYYSNNHVMINDRLISVQISENNSIISIADKQLFEVNEDRFE